MSCLASVKGVFLIEKLVTCHDGSRHFIVKVCIAHKLPAARLRSHSLLFVCNQLPASPDAEADSNAILLVAFPTAAQAGALIAVEAAVEVTGGGQLQLDARLGTVISIDQPETEVDKRKALCVSPAFSFTGVAGLIVFITPTKFVVEVKAPRDQSVW